MLAAFYDDLNFENGGTGYFYTNEVDSAIITWDHVPDWRQEGIFTFQIILTRPAGITYQYLEMGPGRLDECSIGIENSDGTVGLEIAYNASYMHDNLAVRIGLGWLLVSPSSGIVDPHDSFGATVTFDASNLSEGAYTGNIYLDSNDPTNPNVDIPVTLIAGSYCNYVPGDCDYNSVPLELSDVVAMVSMYRGNSDPLYTCDCPPHGSDFAPEADPDGNCVAFELADVVTEIAAYRGTGEASGCPDCPGSRRLITPPPGQLKVIPTLKSKAMESDKGASE
jgi:hypothetical protein